MNPKCQPKPAYGPRGIVPAWADPVALAYGTAFRRHAVNVPMSTETELARADPTRVAIGFATGALILTAVAVSPGGPAQFGGWALDGTPQGSWFDLLTYGVAVQEAWYAFTNFTGDVTVFELYRL